MARKAVEHVDAGRVAEIAAFLVDAEIDQNEPAAGPQFTRAGEQDRLPVPQPLRAKLLLFGRGRADRLDMIGDHARPAADPMHGGRREAKRE